MPEKRFCPREPGKRRRLLIDALEISAAARCNLSCVGCSRSSPEAAPAFADPEEVFRDLRDLSSAAVSKVIRVNGGEPLLHPRLEDLLRAIRRSGISRRITVLTNGTLLKRRPPAWAALADSIRVSVYPSASVDGAALKALEGFCLREGKGFSVCDYHSFQLCLPAAPLSSSVVKKVFQACHFAHAFSCHSVSGGAVYLCLPSLAAGDGGSDVCRIKPLATLEERLEAFLFRREPLSSCRRCLGDSGSTRPHAQAGSRAWGRLSRTGKVDKCRLEKNLADPYLETVLYEERINIPGKKEDKRYARRGINWNGFFFGAAARPKRRPKPHVSACVPPPPNPSAVPAVVAAALALQGQRKYRAALALLDMALKGEGDSALLYNSRGVVLRFLGRDEEAARNFRRALRLEPGFADAAHNLAAIGGAKP